MNPSYNTVGVSTLLCMFVDDIYTVEPDACTNDELPYSYIQWYYFLLYFNVLGPFVMNTNDEIGQATMDYSQGRNGFERAQGWRSEIGKRRR